MGRRALLMGLMLLAIAAAGAGRATAEPNGGVGLTALLKAGRAYHPTLAKQPLLAKSLELEQSQLARAHWPQLSLSGSATWQSDVTSVDIPVPGVSAPTPPQDQYRVALDLQQLIWDGGGTADRQRVAQQVARVQQHQASVQWHQVRDRIQALYFAGLVQQELRAQAQALDGRLATVIHEAELALEHGVITERDVLLARARQLEARQTAAEATSRLAGVRRALGHLTGRPLADETTLAPAPASCTPSLAGKLGPDDVQRPELHVLSAQRQLLGAREDLERAPDQPRIGAFASGGLGRPGLNMLEDDFSFFFIGGLKVTVPLTYLYAGTHGQARERLAIQRAVLDRERDALMTQINVELDTQRSELERLDAIIQLDAEVLALRERARAQTETQLELGTATMTDLIGDLTHEDQARSRLAIHRTERTQACHRLAWIAGKP